MNCESNKNVTLTTITTKKRASNKDEMTLIQGNDDDGRHRKLATN